MTTANVPMGSNPPEITSPLPPPTPSPMHQMTAHSASCVRPAPSQSQSSFAAQICDPVGDNRAISRRRGPHSLRSHRYARVNCCGHLCAPHWSGRKQKSLPLSLSSNVKLCSLAFYYNLQSNWNIVFISNIYWGSHRFLRVVFTSVLRLLAVPRLLQRLGLIKEILSVSSLVWWSVTTISGRAKLNVRFPNFICCG